MDPAPQPQDHPPGARPNRNYRRSGSEAEYLKTAEKASELIASGMSYRQVMRELGVPHLATVHNMVRRYAFLTATLYPPLQQREMIAHKFRRLHALAMNEFIGLCASPESGGVVMDPDKRAARKAELFVFMRDNAVKEATLLGFGAPNINIQFPLLPGGNGGVGAGDTGGVPRLPSPEAQQEIRRLSREMRAVRDKALAVEVEVSEVAAGNGDADMADLDDAAESEDPPPA